MGKVPFWVWRLRSFGGTVSYSQYSCKVGGLPQFLTVLKVLQVLTLEKVHKNKTNCIIIVY